MSKCFVSLGTIDKKLFLPLFYIIIHIFLLFYWEANRYNYASYYIEYLGCSIGEMTTFFIGILFKYHGISKKSKNELEPKYLKNYSFLLAISVFSELNNLFALASESEEERGDTSRELYTNDDIQIIFITLITSFILKYKYYKHHFISIISIVILGIAIDLILNNFKHTDILTFGASILYVLADSFIYCYYKYLIEFKYYYFMDILFISGVMNMCVHTLSFIGMMIYEEVADSKEIIIQFYDLYMQRGIWHMIGRFLVGMLLNGFLVGIIEFLILDKLTPNYIIICYEIGKIPSSLYYYEGWEKWIALVVAILQIISFLFYFEIFEFNFCSLNKNTKRNITKRGN